MLGQTRWHVSFPDDCGGDTDLHRRHNSRRKRVGKGKLGFPEMDPRLGWSEESLEERSEGKVRRYKIIWTPTSTVARTGGKIPLLDSQPCGSSHPVWNGRQCLPRESRCPKHWKYPSDLERTPTSKSLRILKSAFAWNRTPKSTWRKSVCVFRRTRILTWRKLMSVTNRTSTSTLRKSSSVPNRTPTSTWWKSASVWNRTPTSNCPPVPKLSVYFQVDTDVHQMDFGVRFGSDRNFISLMHILGPFVDSGWSIGMSVSSGNEPSWRLFRVLSDTQATTVGATGGRVAAHRCGDIVRKRPPTADAVGDVTLLWHTAGPCSAEGR